MRIVHAKTDSNSKRYVYAADNVFDDPEFSDNPEDDFGGDSEDTDVTGLDADMGEDGQQDGSTIEVDNNITNHLIAECQNCHGIFISAMIASDQLVESINGVCPLCNKDTEQFLKWIVKDYPEE